MSCLETLHALRKFKQRVVVFWSWATRTVWSAVTATGFWFPLNTDVGEGRQRFLRSSPKVERRSWPGAHDRATVPCGCNLWKKAYSGALASISRIPARRRATLYPASRQALPAVDPKDRHQAIVSIFQISSSRMRQYAAMPDFATYNAFGAGNLCGASGKHARK